MIFKLFWILTLTLIINLFFAKIFAFLKFYDLPEKNKIHKKKIVFSGGISIIVSLTILKITNLIDLKELELIYKYSFIIFIIGFVDDKYKISPFKKFLLLFVALIFIYHFSGLPLITFIGNYLPNGGNFGHEIAFILTLSGVFLIINSYNYSDGIDCNCILLFFNSLLILFFFIKLTHGSSLNTDFFIYELLYVTFSVAFIFLIFNRNFFFLPKIFLGDNGSLFLGFLSANILIYLSANKILDPNLLIWVNSLIVFDFFSITLIRFLNKKNIFKRDFNHIHLLIFRRKKNIFYTLILINIINFTFGVIGFIIFFNYGQLASVMAYIVSFLVYTFFHKKFLNHN